MGTCATINIVINKQKNSGASKSMPLYSLCKTINVGSPIYTPTPE